MSSRSIFQKALLGFIFFFPYSILYVLGKGEDQMGMLGLYLVPFFLIAILVSETTKNIQPGKEDYVLIPLLLLYVFPFDLGLFKIIAFLIMGTVSFFMLIKK